MAAVSKRLPELRRAGLIEKTGREVAGGECEYRIGAGRLQEQMTCQRK